MKESRLLRLAAVLTLTGLKKSSIYKKANEGTFPKPLKLSSRAVAWRFDEVQQWIDNLPRVES